MVIMIPMLYSVLNYHPILCLILMYIGKRRQVVLVLIIVVQQQQNGSGNVYLSGSQESDSYGLYDYGVIKLDSSGNILWQKKIGGTGNDYGYAIAVDVSGNVYLNGYQGSDSYGLYDYGVVKLDGDEKLELLSNDVYKSVPEIIEEN